MKEFQGYKCDHCGKLYQRKKACKKHENELCGKAPKNNHPCFNCPHLHVEIIDVFYGHHYNGAEIWNKSKAFQCTKKNINLYSYKFDKHIRSYDAPVFDDTLPLERMPCELNSCLEDKTSDIKIGWGSI